MNFTEVKTFYPVGKSDNEYELRHTLYQLKNSYGVEVPELRDKLHNMETVRKEKENELLSYIRQNYGKYLKFKCSYNVNYGGDREENPKWHYDIIFNMYVYRYLESNDSMFGVVSFLHDEYNSGVYEHTISLKHMLEGHRMEICEIDYDTFISEAHAAMERTLQTRLDKISSGKYELTNEGYVYPKSNIDYRVVFDNIANCKDECGCTQLSSNKVKKEED